MRNDWAARFEAIMRERLDGDASHDLGHLRRVWNMTQTIAAHEGGDRDILVAAAWLHDLVNLPKDASNRDQASRLSAEAALPILRMLDFPEAKIAAVEHAIVAHSFSAGIAVETLEAKIVQDADRLDSLGAIGLARTFYIAGRMGWALFDIDDPLAETRALDDRRFSLDHFEVKLLKIGGLMNTATAREIAARRSAYLRQFREQLLTEIL